jgi:hypothetical protein
MKLRGWSVTALAIAGAMMPASAQMIQRLQPRPILDDPVTRANGAAQLERDRPAGWALAEHRRLEKALAALQPERKGLVDAYVVSIALDSDPVFGREAREAGRVLARRYDAVGRTVVLASGDGSGPATTHRGSPDALAAVLARVAELMNPAEDVLVLYATTHGAPFGIAYTDGEMGSAMISPKWLRNTLVQLGIRNRLLIISACFSGIFVPPLSSDDGVVLSAASSSRTSFGCVSENDWTFFGDAMINHALRKPQPIAAAFAEARSLVGEWEARGRLIPSEPQASFGAGAARWLAPLEARMPKVATASVGRPAVEALGEASRNNH